MEGEETIKDINKEVTIKVKDNILLIIKNKIKINNIIIPKLITKFSINNILKDMEDIMKVQVMFMRRSKNPTIINNKINLQLHR